MTQTTALSSAVSFTDVERMALAVAKSGLFGIRTPEQAISLMLIAQAEGLHPALAARDYHVINGKPTLKSDALLARFQANGGRVEWTEYTDRAVAAKVGHPAGGTVTIRWTIEQAERAGLTRNPTWKSYPRQMLRARVISEGVRAVFPGVAVGVYTSEEVQDMTAATASSVAIADEPVVASPVALVREAPDVESLKTRYRDAMVVARKAKDKELEAQLSAAKDARKAELEAIDAEPATPAEVAP
jgi:hypothetical protein